ncbi:MAG: PepSY-associated TM helix domain-containing protein [Halioglobus sp.]
MSRKLFVSIHLHLAAFFAPAVLLVAISGGLYLIGIKGEVELETVYSGSIQIDPNSDTLKSDIGSLLRSAGVVGFEFEYVKINGRTLYTRPTSSDHYVIQLGTAGVEIVHARPNLQSRMIELHKGHGPSAFKTYQKFFAMSLVLIIVSGLWLGLLNARLRRTTLYLVGVGGAIFSLLLL